MFRNRKSKIKLIFFLILCLIIINKNLFWRNWRVAISEHSVAHFTHAISDKNWLISQLFKIYVLYGVNGVLLILFLC